MKINIKITLIILVIIVVTLACKKDNYPLGGGGAIAPPYKFICDTLPTQPTFGWIDTLTDKNKNVFRYYVNPAYTNQALYIIGGYTGVELYSCDLITGTKKLIDKSLKLIPQINKDGWLTYNKANYQVYIIKPNGDSLKNITSNNTSPSYYPVWDYTGKYIYYWQNAIGSIPLTSYKINKNGTKIDSFPNLQVIASCKKSNTILGYRYTITSGYYVIRNIDTGIETTFYPDVNGTNYPTFDDEDAYIYYISNKYLGRQNITTAKVDTLLNLCASFDIFTTNISLNSNYLTFCLQTNVPVVGSPLKLFHQQKVIKMDLYTKKFTEIRLFN